MTGHWPRYPLTTPWISVQIVNTWNQRFLPKLFARNTLVQWLLKRLSRWETRWCQSYIPNISKSNCLKMLGKPTTSVDHQMFPHCFCLPFWEDYSLICCHLCTRKTQPCPSPPSGPVQKWPKSRASTRCAYPWKISRSVDQSVSWKDSQDFNGKPNGHGDFERWVL